MSFHERVQRFSGLGLTWEGSETQILTVLENTVFGSKVNEDVHLSVIFSDPLAQIVMSNA